VTFNPNIPGFVYRQCASTNGYDLRFSDSAVTREINYEIEKWDTNGTSFVWVQVPTLAANTDYIWAYWGNPTQTNQQAYTANGATWSEGYQAVYHMCQANAQDSTSNKNHAVSSGNTNVNGIISTGRGSTRANTCWRRACRASPRP